MKSALIIGGLLIVGVISFMVWSPSDAPKNSNPTNAIIERDTPSNSVQTGSSLFTEGTYVVEAEESLVTWAGKKPFIEGYINSGSIGVTGGVIEVAENSSVTGVFTFDMNTLSVSETPTKPGQESGLEGHLKGERWFDVTTFPEASFAITAVTPRADSATTFQYDVSGQLTMKGVTDTLTFPATIYLDKNGLLHAEADFEFDRTIWGITAGSGSFFDDLADNVIDDMVALSFSLVAAKQ